MSLPLVLVLSYSHLRSDPRVRRQIRALAKHYRVVSCGYGDAPADVVRHVSIPSRRRPLFAKAADAVRLTLGLHEAYYWSQPRVSAALEALSGGGFDLVVANDLPALPLGLELAGWAPLIYDAHEYSPLEFEDKPLWRFFFARYADFICRHHLRRAAAISTVCQGIADKYATEYGVRCEVITNAAPYAALPVQPTKPQQIRMIHHGAAMASRRIELMIELMGRLDERFTLDFILVPQEPRYLSRLKRRAAKNPRIRFLPPMLMDELVAFSSSYDIGLFLLPPTNFNYQMALPNKFFEFTQARLAVAIGPSPEMARLVREFNSGIVAATFEPGVLADALSACTAEDLDRMKRGADRAAKVLNAEANEAAFLATVQRLLAHDRRGSVPISANA